MRPFARYIHTLHCLWTVGLVRISEISKQTIDNKKKNHLKGADCIDLDRKIEY